MSKRLMLILMAGLWAAPVAQAKEATGAQEVFIINGKEVQLARYAKALIGSGNVTVEIAPYKTGRKEGAILLFRGIEGDWDGQAVNHSVEPGSYNGHDYVTEVDGKRWVTLIERPDRQGKKQYELYVPGVNEELKLAPSDGAAQLTNPRKIFQEYQAQQGAKKE